jgi:flagellar basal-body rod protein FlgB
MRILDSLFDRTVTGLTKAMDLSWRKNETLVSNIANAETPQYRAVNLDFGSELDRAFGSPATEELARTDTQHLDLTNKENSKLVPDFRGATKADGNNVDIDLQMSSLAQNGGDYANAAQLIRRQIGLVRSAIRDGR